MRNVWICRVIVALVAASGSIALTPAQTVWSQALGIGGAVDLASDPLNGHIFAVVQGSGPGIYRSRDGGHSFRLLKSFTQPHKLALGNGANLWVATSQGLYKTNNFTTWTAVTGGLPPGQSVTFVGWGTNTHLYATVSSGAFPGLYRSVNSGVAWSLVLGYVQTQSVTDGSNCGTALADTVFAGGTGPVCTLWKSTNGGASFSCTAFPHIVKEVAMDCTFSSPTFTQLFITSPEGAPVQAVRRSTDVGATFINDGNGLIDVGATNTIDFVYDKPGVTVGTSYTGLFKRLAGPPGTAWTQFSTEGLLDQRIKDWAIYDHDGLRYDVVATPTGVFAFHELECIPPGDPNVPCQ